MFLCWILVIQLELSLTKVNFVLFFVRVEGHDIFGQTESVSPEVVGKCERMILSPMERHLIDCVFVLKVINFFVKKLSKAFDDSHEKL